MRALRSLELVAAGCASVGLALRFVPSLDKSERAFLAGAIVLFFVSQSLRMLERSPSLGPLVLMAIKMVEDTLRFLLLAVGVLVGFACGMVTLFKGSHAGGLGEDCTVFDDGWMEVSSGENVSRGEDLDSDGVEAEGGGFMQSAILLFEIMLGSDNQLDCLRESTHPVTSVIFMDAFLIGAVLLGTNMLIALMAKTFDVFYEHQVQNFMFLSAMLTASWSKASAVPPPFAVLGLPYFACTRLCKAVAAVCAWCCPWLYKAVAAVSAWCCPWWCDRNGGHGRLEEEQDDKRLEGMPTVAQLKAKMEEYLSERDGEDDRWRMHMAEQQAKLLQLAEQLAQAKQPQQVAVGQSNEVNGLEQRLALKVNGLEQKVNGLEQQLALVLTKLDRIAEGQVAASEHMNERGQSSSDQGDGARLLVNRIAE